MIQSHFFIDEDRKCRHCGAVKRNQTTDFCYKCMKGPGDMTQQEAEEMQLQEILIYRTMMRGEIP